MTPLSSMIRSSILKRLGMAFLLFLPIGAIAQETIAPPSLGQQTQGEPAIAENTTDTATQASNASNIEEAAAENQSTGLLGTTQISELRRESGQIYRIELEHSSGSKQYIDEFDSDGKIESTNNDIEETPNLAKWRLGSW